MPPSQSVTETIILRPKEGVHLDNVTGGANASGCPAVQAFVQLTNTLKSQPGLIRQFWGHQVENPHIFVWSIDWESFEHHAAFINSEEHNSFMAGLGQVFDVKVAVPVMLYTRFTSNEATAAFKAPVTEVAFFTLPNGASEDAKTTIEDASVPTLETVQSVGKAQGAAIGWVELIAPLFKGMPHAAVSGGDALCGVFGYASIDDHMKWRETPQGVKAREVDEDPDRRNISLEPATSVPGIDPSTGYFHVKFHEGL